MSTVNGSICIATPLCHAPDHCRIGLTAGMLPGAGCLPGLASNDSNKMSIIVVGTSQSGGNVLLEAATLGGSVSIWAPPLRAVDPSAGLIWLIAVGTAVGAALWAGLDFKAELRAAGSQQVHCYHEAHKNARECIQCQAACQRAYG